MQKVGCDEAVAVQACLRGCACALGLSLSFVAGFSPALFVNKFGSKPWHCAIIQTELQKTKQTKSSNLELVLTKKAIKDGTPNHFYATATNNRACPPRNWASNGSFGHPVSSSISLHGKIESVL